MMIVVNLLYVRLLDRGAGLTGVSAGLSGVSAECISVRLLNPRVGL